VLNETVQGELAGKDLRCCAHKEGRSGASARYRALCSQVAGQCARKPPRPVSPVVPLSEAVPDLTKNRRARLQAGLLMTVRVCVNRPIGRPQAPRPSLVSPARPVNETSSLMSGLSPRVCSRDGGSVQLVDPGDLEIFQVGEASTSSDCCWSGSLE
jgi:hypothetical protein